MFHFLGFWDFLCSKANLKCLHRRQLTQRNRGRDASFLCNLAILNVISVFFRTLLCSVIIQNWSIIFLWKKGTCWRWLQPFKRVKAVIFSPFGLIIQAYFLNNTISTTANYFIIPEWGAFSVDCLAMLCSKKKKKKSQALCIPASFGLMKNNRRISFVRVSTFLCLFTHIQWILNRVLPRSKLPGEILAFPSAYYLSACNTGEITKWNRNVKLWGPRSFK